MSSLEYYGINKQNIEEKIISQFGGSNFAVISRADDYSSQSDVLLSFKSNNNDVCLNSVAAAVAREFSMERSDLSDKGHYLIIRKK